MRQRRTHALEASRPILIADDDRAFRGFVASALNAAGFSTREVVTGEEALKAAAAERLALVLLDVCLPSLTGYEVCRQLREAFGEGLPIVFVSGIRTEPFDRVGGLLIGADDYLAKPFDPAELVARVRRLVGRSPQAHDDARFASLTPREQEVLHLLATGHDQTEIAHELFISPKTVATHIQRILTKLGVRNRAQAVTMALRGEQRPVKQRASG